VPFPELGVDIVDGAYSDTVHNAELKKNSKFYLR
jgi:hypothetical protein